MMKFLDRKQYNKIIEKLNNHKNMDDSAQEELIKQYDELLCKLSDYEEIVLLLNICIAYDRNDKIEELYKYYLKIVNMLDDHCGIGLKNLYYIYYCMGVFSFKLHDYDKADIYLKKCEEQIKCMELSKEKSKEEDLVSTTSIQTKILLSYVMEYKKIGEGSYSAICNILDSGKLNEDFDVCKISADDPEDVVAGFFKNNSSQIYNEADELMKKEIIHVLSHCFSEYSIFLRKNQKEPKKVFLWEKMSEKFVSRLGEKMITCQAIIMAEHGHYCQAIDMMKVRCDELPKDGIEKERAELAFYIYYFNNQIGSYNDAYADECKKYFLKFSEKEESNNTKFYAWIVDFRENFAKALKLEEEESIKELEKLEGKCKEIDELIKKQNYIHPQILEEKHRLLLAYQILRSYLQINNRKDGHSVEGCESDNSLFEKCVMFNKKNVVKKNEEDKKGCSWEKKADEQIELQGVSLCIYGMTDDICKNLEEQFCTKIYRTDKEMISKQKVIIYDEEVEIDNFIDNLGKDLTYFIYCKNPEDVNKLGKRKEHKGINADISNNLATIIKTAYIQETLENCNLCANRWDEFFIMAPITDNATFAFQNQSIKKYLEVIEDDAEERDLFLDDHGYETSVWKKLNGIKIIDYRIDINQEKMKQWRLYFFHEQWLYFYEREKNQFVPFKLLDSVKTIGETMIKLQKYPRRNDRKRHSCKCQLSGRNCLCEKWSLNGEEEIIDLLLSLSIGFPNSKEKYCTIIFTSKLQEEQPLGDMFILLSDEVEMSYEFRVLLKKVSDICEQNERKKKENEQAPNEHAANGEAVEKCDKLIEEINKYIRNNKSDIPVNSSDYKEIMKLRKDIEDNRKEATDEQYEDYVKRWKNILHIDI